MRVALIGMGPSADSYARHVAMAGDWKVLFDEVWTVNAFGSVFHVDRIFHMDDVRIQQVRADGGNKQIANMLDWLKRVETPVFTSRAHPDYPMLEEFPLEDVVNSTGGMLYFNSTPAYAVAYAMHIGVTHLMLFGIDYAFNDKYAAERGRSCIEFWLGRAMERSIGQKAPDNAMEVGLPKGSWLFDNNRKDTLYGYDTRRVSAQRTADGRIKLTFTEVDTLPSAETIEALYDHSLVKEQKNGKCSLSPL